MNLYQISLQYRNLENALINNEGELTPELEELLTVNEANRDEQTKNLFYLMAEKEDEIEAIDSRINKLQELKKSKTLTKDSCKKALENAVMLFGELKVDEFNLKTRISKSVNVYDESKLPKEYLVEKITTQPDKKAIGELLKRGGHVSGAELIVKNNLSIK